MSDTHRYYTEINFNTILDFPGGDILQEEFFDCDVFASSEAEAKRLGLARCGKGHDMRDYDDMLRLSDRFPDDPVDTFTEIVDCRATPYKEVDL